MRFDPITAWHVDTSRSIASETLDQLGDLPPGDVRRHAFEARRRPGIIRRLARNLVHLTHRERHGLGTATAQPRTRKSRPRMGLGPQPEAAADHRTRQS